MSNSGRFSIDALVLLPMLAAVGNEITRWPPDFDTRGILEKQ